MLSCTTANLLRRCRFNINISVFVKNVFRRIRYHPLVGITPKRELCALWVILYLVDMSQNPQSLPFVREVLQTLVTASSADVSQTDERWL